MRSPFRPDEPIDDAVLDDHRSLIRGLERRGLVRGGLSLGALAMLTGCDVRRPEAVQSALLAVSRFNDDVQAWLFDPSQLAPTYPASLVLKPPKFNAYYDVIKVRPVDGATWRLELSGLDRRPHSLDDRRDRRVAADHDDHQACLRRRLELHRPVVGGAARHLPPAGRRRPEGEVRRLPHRR